MNSAEFNFLKDFTPNLSNFCQICQVFAKFGSLNVQILDKGWIGINNHAPLKNQKLKIGFLFRVDFFLGEKAFGKKKVWKSIIFIACKWSKICKYYVNSMVISCSTCQKKKNNAEGLNIWFTLFCRNFKFVVIYAFSRQICIPKISEFIKKMVFSQVLLQCKCVTVLDCKSSIV